MTPRILFLGLNDWGGIARRIASAINELAGASAARLITLREHPLGYEPPDWVVQGGRLGGLMEFASSADWIISTGDGHYEFFQESLDRLPLKAGVKVGVTHAGTAFRQEPEKYHTLDDAIGARVRFVGADSYYLMNGDPRAVPYFGPAQIFEPYPLPYLLSAAHSPSSQSKKGTALIMSVLTRMQCAGYMEVDLIQGVPWEEAVARRRRSQIFVDQMMPCVGGWGMSAIEALGAGCATLADLNHVVPDVYGFFPKPPIEDVRSPGELEDWLKLWHSRRDLLEKRRQEALAWARAHAAPAAVAKYVLGHLERLGG